MIRDSQSKPLISGISATDTGFYSGVLEVQMGAKPYKP